MDTTPGVILFYGNQWYGSGQCLKMAQTAFWPNWHPPIQTHQPDHYLCS